MHDQEKREKVIKDLEHARRLSWNGEHCDIMDDDDALTVSYAITDALALLKAQEPCEDAVSREAVIKSIEWWFGILKQNPDILIDSIKTLPDVQPMPVARLMTLEELNLMADESVVCWVEYKGKPAINVTAPYWSNSMKMVMFIYLGTEHTDVVFKTDYNKTWRCWTSEPTDDQRKAVAWDDKE